MAEYGVARGTAHRAVEVHRDRGIVFTVPQRGMLREAEGDLSRPAP